MRTQKLEWKTILKVAGRHTKAIKNHSFFKTEKEALLAATKLRKDNRSFLGADEGNSRKGQWYLSYRKILARK